MSLGHITVSVASFHPWEEELKALFYLMLDDYSKKFNLKVTETRYHVAIAMVEYFNKDIGSELGLTTFAGDRILIQFRDPYMDLESMDDQHPFIDAYLISTICHEYVHACQALCKSKGTKYKVVKEDNAYDNYYFDPDEIEARILESYYAFKYAMPLLKNKQPTINTYEED
jgi:hypothetical protein